MGIICSRERPHRLDGRRPTAHACAHLSEETREASVGAAKGVWKAIFYSAIGGWILLLCFLFAATNVDAINKNPFGYIVIAVQLPDAASIDRTTEVSEKINNVLRDTPGVENPGTPNWK